MFSVIMPVYNARAYLRSAIEDILNQTFRNFELLLIDDGSTDGSGEICDIYAGMDARVRVVHKKNGGISQARNVGLQCARHDYIYFMDDDDRVSEHLLEKMRRFIIKYSPDLICFGSNIFDMEKNRCKGRTERRLPFFFCNSGKQLFNRYYATLTASSMLNCVWDKIYKRELIERCGMKFDESFTHGGEDVCFNLGLLGHVERIVNTSIVYYDYYLRDTQSTVKKFNPRGYQQGLRLLQMMQKIAARYRSVENTANLYSAYCLNILDAVGQLERVGAPRGFIGKYRYVCSALSTDSFGDTFKNEAADCFEETKGRSYAGCIVRCAVKKRFFLLCVLQTLFSCSRALWAFLQPFVKKAFARSADAGTSKQSESRSVNSLRNIVYGVGGQFISLLLSFVNRSIFIYSLGFTYLGINGLFSNVLSLLSFAELGIGSAITFSLYKPLKDKNIEQIKSLMRLYGISYRLIGGVICVVGLILTPFLDVFIKDKPNIPHLQLYYLLMLAGTVATYFFTYKRSIILSDQKGYLNTKNTYAFTILQSLAQIVVMVFIRSYILYLITGIVMLVISNISISHKANAIYPYLKEKNIRPIEKTVKTSIIKNTTALVFHKVGGALNTASDNIIISTFIGLVSVGLYSNYFLIINTVQSFIAQIFNSMLSSVANLLVTSDKDQSYALFNKMNFANFWIDCFCTTSLWTLMNPFLLVWLHNTKYLFNDSVLLVLTVNFFLLNFHHTSGVFINSAGLFWKNKYKPFFECSIKLLVSIWLVNKLGVVGVFIGTLCSFLLTSFWVEAFILFKNMFHRSIVTYLIRYAMYAAVACMTAFVTKVLCGFIPDGSLICFFAKALVCVLVPNGLLFLLFFKTRHFRECVDMISPLARKFFHGSKIGGRKNESS